MTNEGVFQGSPRPPYIQSFARRISGAQHIVVLTAKIYYSDLVRIQEDKRKKMEPGEIHVQVSSLLSLLFLLSLCLSREGLPESTLPSATKM